MIQWFKRLVFIIQMGTVLPFGVSPKMSEDDYPRALSLFPFAGLVVGALSLIFGLAGIALRSKLLAACFAIVGNLLITKGFHLDGWSDTLDALGSSKDRQAKLDIMKDSHTGVMGAAGIAVNLGLKVALVYELLQVSFPAALAAVMAAPIAAKLALVTAAKRSQSARAGGLASAYLEKLTRADEARAIVITAVLLLPLAGLYAAVYIAVALLVGLLCAALFKRVLGGMTGDTLGFTNELAEITVLLSFYIVRGLITNQ